jgi:hypothetical protein
VKIKEKDMFDDIWFKHGLPKPPGDFDEKFWAWLWETGKQLNVSLFDYTPIRATDLDELKRTLGNPHPELECFYSKCTPWGSMQAGIEIWNRHLQRIHQYARQTLLSRGDLSSGDIASALAVSPSLWPVNLSPNAAAVAFSDSQGRLAILNGNIDPNLGRPLALGLRNFMIMTVIAEIVWEEKNYQSYKAVLDDETVRAAGLWPDHEAPSHPLIEAFEALKFAAHERKLGSFAG